jgi:hypothetical protein
VVNQTDSLMVSSYVTINISCDQNPKRRILIIRIISINECFPRRIDAD